jgi:hypothetical protein
MESKGKEVDDKVFHEIAEQIFQVKYFYHDEFIMAKAIEVEKESTEEKEKNQKESQHDAANLSPNGGPSNEEEGPPTKKITREKKIEENGPHDVAPTNVRNKSQSTVMRAEGIARLWCLLMWGRSKLESVLQAEELNDFQMWGETVIKMSFGSLSDRGFLQTEQALKENFLRSTIFHLCSFFDQQPVFLEEDQIFRNRRLYLDTLLNDSNTDDIGLGATRRGSNFS